MDLSVVIPFYNEQPNIDTVLSELRDRLEGLDISSEIVAVDDGSTDETAELLDKWAEMTPGMTVVHLCRNFGQTAAIMAGIDTSTGETVITMDGDGQNDPADIPALLSQIDRGNDCCSGWRKKRKDPFFTRLIPSSAANVLISLVCGVKLRDYGCTLKAYRRRIIGEIRLYGEMHRFIPVYAAWQGARVTEIPVNHRPRTRGRSKYGLIRTLKVLLDLLVVKFFDAYFQKPIYLFGGFAFVNWLFCLASFGGMVYYKFWGGKSFIQTPLPFLVVLFALVGILSLLIGLVAEVQMRTYYESQKKTSYVVSSRVHFSGNK